MTRAQARGLHVSTALVAGTGFVYGWMRYFARSEDPFAIANHPWQPELQHAHVLMAPLLVFLCGLVWSEHVWSRWRRGFRARRKTGIALGVLFVPMIVSGYALQVSSNESWRLAWIWCHGLVSVGWTGCYLVHQFLEDPRKARARSVAPPSGDPAPEQALETPAGPV